MADYEDDQFDRDDYGEEDHESEQPSLSDTPSLQQLQKQVKNQQDLEKTSNQSSNSQNSEFEGLSIEQDKYIELQDDEIPFPQPNKIRITNPYLTKYERAIIIGRRATQIQNGSPIYTKLTVLNKEGKNKGKGERVLMNPIQIAEKEFQENSLPFIVRRFLPNGEFEDWKIQELKK